MGTPPLAGQRNRFPEYRLLIRKRDTCPAGSGSLRCCSSGATLPSYMGGLRQTNCRPTVGVVASPAPTPRPWGQTGADEPTSTQPGIALQESGRRPPRGIHLSERHPPRHPRRSCAGRRLTPQSGDPFAMTSRVAPTSSVGRALRELLAASTPLDPPGKPKDDDGPGVCWWIPFGCRRPWVRRRRPLRRPRRSRTGRRLTPRSGDPFAMTWRVAPTGSIGHACRELLAALTPLDPRVKPKDDDDRGVGR